MDLHEEMKREAEKYGAGSSSDFFRFEKSGTYRLRVLTGGAAIATHFFGKGVKPSICYGQDKGCMFHGESDASLKWVMYVLDRQDGKIKLGEIPWSVASVIADLSKDEDYAFSSYPIPYDIKVVVDKENSDPKQMYKTIASPNRTDLDERILGELEEKMKKMSPEKYVERRKEKQMEAHKENGTWQAEQERRERLKDELETAKEAAQLKKHDMAGTPEEINPEDIPF